MLDKNMPELKIGNLIARIPVIQGGMGVGISLSGLASAVANQGGIGVISSVGLSTIYNYDKANYREANSRLLREEIRKARAKTSGIIGVNIMVALTDYQDLVKASIDEGADILFLGAGLPLHFPKEYSGENLKKVKSKLVPIVSSGRAANLIFKYWQKNFDRLPDAVVVEGPKAGGHLGFKKEQISNPDYALENLIPDVIEAVSKFTTFGENEIPVIAAGGIYTGRDIHKFINMGADGVQMGTRFVATHECDASDQFKDAYLKCSEKDIMIIQSPVGLPGRAIRNTFLEEVSRGVRKPFKCPWKCLITCDFKNTPYCIANALTNARIGKMLDGFAFAGANAFRVDKILSVKELINTLKTEYEKSLSDAMRVARLEFAF
ncbi:nitronate monooxygenase [bacterium]|nr:nitronate monooxygenase [bacterium]